LREPAVVFDHVWKKFDRTPRVDSLRDLVPAMVSNLVRGRSVAELRDKEFWALQDVSFEVRSGEALGIIGPNGAGKSTALKILTKVLRANRGTASVRGRVGALVEIAAGFHPDLTGRENVFMQGAIMGMSRAEVIRKFDNIVEFAGVGDFIDTQVKRYSSGMNARLGFAVAAHLDPDVLLIDEVLSVGDLSFQERCFDRMQGFVKSGIPVVFVSHNLGAVSALCDRVLVLNGGRVEALAPTREAIAVYAKLVHAAQAQEVNYNVVTLALQDFEGRGVTEVRAGDPFRVRVSAYPDVKGGSLQAELQIRHLQSGSLICRIDSRQVGGDGLCLEPGRGLEAVWALSANLGRGHYGISCTILDAQGRRVAATAPAVLAVTERQSIRATVYLDASCELRPLKPPTAVSVAG
jgi:lipopolysaccharide transport system ATP-binding protein